MTTTEVAEKLYYRIGEVEAITTVPAYVLRYWESEFKLLRPKKNPAGQRLYRPRDLELVQRIKTLLYEERLTLEPLGAARARRERGHLRGDAAAHPRPPRGAALSPGFLKAPRISATIDD